GVMETAPRDRQLWNEERQSDECRESATDHRQHRATTGSHTVHLPGGRIDRAGGSRQRLRSTDARQDPRDEQQQEDEECSKPVLAARGASLEVDVVLEEALDGLAEGCAVERQREVIGAGGTAWRSTEALPPIA